MELTVVLHSNPLVLASGSYGGVRLLYLTSIAHFPQLIEPLDVYPAYCHGDS